MNALKWRVRSSVSITEHGGSRPFNLPGVALKEYARHERVGTQIQRELSELVRDKIRDPRIGIVTIQDVRVSRDLSWAKVYITGVGLHGQADEPLKVLNRAKGFLRHELGQRMSLRIVPALDFVYDESIERGEHLESLISQANKDISE